MILNWQDTIALAAVAAAIFFVWRHLRRSTSLKGTGGCSGCGDCPMQKAGKPLVTIGSEKIGPSK